MTQRLPAIFLGHGNPMNALSNNDWTRGWATIGQSLPHPRAVLSVSAHWYVDKTAVTAMPVPRTIHDFAGFPEELFDVRYPAPGHPDLARRLIELLRPLDVDADLSWGLDHGTWSVMRHLYPNADVPVIQLSIDRSRPSDFHYNVGRRLRSLRDEGVLLIGSGNVVHNLRRYSWGDRLSAPFDWAARFDAQVRELISEHNDAALVFYSALGSDAVLSVPTPDHYLPLLYVIGARHDDDVVTFPVDGMDGGSISMLGIQLG